MSLSDYLSNGSWLSQKTLPHPYVLCTIETYGESELDNEKQMYLEFTDGKRFGLNDTNLKRLIAFFGYDEKVLIGKQVVIYRTTTAFKGQQVLCARLTTPDRFPFKTDQGVQELVYDAQGSIVQVNPIPQPQQQAQPPAPVQQPAAPQPVQQAPPPAPVQQAPPPAPVQQPQAQEPVQPAQPQQPAPSAPVGPPLPWSTPS